MALRSRSTLPALAVALGLVGAMLPELVLSAGIAPAVVCAGVTWFVAAASPPLGELPPRWLRAGGGLILGAVLAAACGASAIPAPVLVLTVGVPAAVLARLGLPAVRTLAALALLVTVAWIVPLVFAAPAEPWTALVPMWLPSEGLAGGVALGAALGVLALLAQAQGELRTPGRPLAVISAALALGSLIVGLSWEAGPPVAPGALPLTATLGVLATAWAVSALVALRSLQGASSAWSWSDLEPVGWAFGIAVAGVNAQAWVLHAVLPVGVAALLAGRADRSWQGIAAGVGALAALVAAILSAPGIAGGTLEATGTAAVLVALAWRLVWPTLSEVTS